MQNEKLERQQSQEEVAVHKETESEDDNNPYS